jgi:hypothetical protein
MAAPHNNSAPFPPVSSLGAAAARDVAGLATQQALDEVVATQRSVYVGGWRKKERQKKSHAAPVAPHHHHLSHRPSPTNNSLLRLRSARAALDRGDTPESSAAVKAATQEIARNAALLNDARADLEDVFRRARALRRRLEAAFPPPPPPETETAGAAAGEGAAAEAGT